MRWKKHRLGQRPPPRRCLSHRRGLRLAKAAPSPVLKCTPLSPSPRHSSGPCASLGNQESIKQEVRPQQALPIPGSALPVPGSARSESSHWTGASVATAPWDAMPIAARQPPEESAHVQPVLRQRHLVRPAPRLGATRFSQALGGRQLIHST